MVIDETATGGCSVAGTALQTLNEALAGYKCKRTAEYIRGLYCEANLRKPHRTERAKPKALVAGITVCEQNLQRLLVKPAFRDGTRRYTMGANGTALVGGESAITIMTTSLGGVYGDGAVTVLATYSLTAAGGVRGAGVDATSFVFNNSATGGVHGAGAGLVVFEGTVATTGGAYGAGAGVVSTGSESSSSGGVYGAGAGVELVRYAVDPSGGVYGASSADHSILVYPTPSGGVYGASSAVVAAQYTVTPTGGVYGAGVADEFMSEADPETLYFFDDFNRANSALGGTGNSWADSTTSWQISSNKVVSPGSGFQTKLLARPVGETLSDLRIRTTINHPGGLSVLIWGRATPASSNGYAGWLGAGNISVGTITGGGVTSNSASASLGAQDYDLSLTVNSGYIVIELFEVGGTTPLYRICREATTYGSGVAALSPLGNGVSADDFRVYTADQMYYLVPDGDSITQGSTIFGWPGYALCDLGLTWRGSANFGVSGQTVTQMSSDFGTQIAPVIAASSYPVHYICAGGTNDIYFGATAATLQTRVTDIINSALSAGATKVGVVTLLSRNDFPGTSSLPGGSAAAMRIEFDARRADYNTWLRANAAGLGAYVIDWAADSRMTNTANTAVFQGDQVHPNVAGTGILGEIAATAIAANV